MSTIRRRNLLSHYIFAESETSLGQIRITSSPDHLFLVRFMSQYCAALSFRRLPMSQMTGFLRNHINNFFRRRSEEESIVTQVPVLNSFVLLGERNGTRWYFHGAAIPA